MARKNSSLLYQLMEGGGGGDVGVGVVIVQYMCDEGQPTFLCTQQSKNGHV